MYVPSHFEQKDVEKLHALIAAHPLGTLVINGPEGLSANPFPFELIRTPEPFGTLRGHIARANPMWRAFSAQNDALVIFNGADSYISPSWYPSKYSHGKVVPTWNYLVAQARGRVKVIDDATWLEAHLGRLTSEHESRFAFPWSMADAPGSFIEKSLGAVVGIEIVVHALEGKWKVSQNRPAQDRKGVAAALREQNTSAAQTMAAFVDDPEGQEPQG